MTAYRGVFRTWTNICKGAFFAKLLNGFKLLPILAKKAPSQMFDWVGNGLLAKGLKYWAHSSSQPLNYAEKILSQKILMTFFLKRSWGDSKQKECLFRSSCSPKGSFKKTLWELLLNSQENICTGTSFFVFSCEFCETCKITFFAEQHLTTASEYSREYCIGKRNGKLWYKS